MNTTFNRSIAVLAIRLMLGIVFFMQGYGKVIKAGVEVIYQGDFFYGKYKDLLPDFLIKATAYYTSYVELIASALLIIGFKRDYALYALASVLLVVSFGHGLTNPVWNMHHVMYRAILLFALLLLPKEWDRYSVDGLLKKQ